MVMQGLSCSFVGTPVSVQAQLDAFRANYQPNEIMITQRIFDHATQVTQLGIVQKPEFQLNPPAAADFYTPSPTICTRLPVSWFQ